jgi:hypothetical protein
MMWIDLSAVLVASHRPVRVSRVVPGFVVDTAEHETGGEGPSDE